MNNLDQKAITTLEVAEMMGINHKEILRKLEGARDRKGYTRILTENHLALSDYFAEATYKDASGKENKCYLVTKLGCDFLANKFTGEKGILFTAKYVKRFRDMEEIIQKPLSQQDMMRIQLGMIDNHEERIGSLENTMNIDYAQQKQLKNFAKEVVVSALGGKGSTAYTHKNADGSKISSQCFSRFWRDFNDYFNINAYANLARVKFDEALQYVNRWNPPTNMQLEIGRINRDCA